LEDFPGQAAIHWEAAPALARLTDVGSQSDSLTTELFPKNARALLVSSVEASSRVAASQTAATCCFAFSFDASFPAFWDAELARSSRRPVSRIFFPELAVSQPGKRAHQKTYPGKSIPTGRWWVSVSSS